MMKDLNERTVVFLFKNNQAISKLVMLVFVSVNHLLPSPPIAVEEEKVEQPEVMDDSDQNLNQQEDEIVSENHEVTQEEIIDAQSSKISGSDIMASPQEEEQQMCWAEAAP